MKSLYKYLIITSLLFSSAGTTFAVFLPIYFDWLGMSYFEIGFLMGILSIPAALMCLYVGYLEEKIDKIRMLITSHFTYALLPIFYFLSSNFLSLLIARLYDGLVSSFKFVPTYTLLESKKSYDTGVNIGVNEAFMNVGSLVGPLIAGALIVHFDIRIIFVMTFVILVPMALMGFGMLKYSKISFNRKMSFTKLLKREFRNRPFMLLALVYMLFIVVSCSFRFLAVPLLMYEHGFDEMSIAIVASSMFLFTFVLELFSGKIETDSMNDKLLTLGIFLGAVAVLLLLLVPLELFYLIVIALLFSIAVALVRPAVFSDLVVLENSHSNMATGVLFFFGYVGALIGNMLGGALLEISFDSFFVFAGTLLVLTALLSLYFHVRKK